MINEVTTLLPENQFSTFEEDYLSRTYSQITNRPDLAFTELVANAWDSGAETIKIVIPKPSGVVETYLSIEDDGVGMTEQEFYDRWMKLAYNRLKHQGEYADMPPERLTQKRRAYGRNGVGRHSMLCFANKYTVETWRDGVACSFLLEQSGGQTALSIKEKQTFEKPGHGTKITARIDKNYPDVSKITEILSARFIYDPQFRLYINDQLVDLEQFPGSVVTEEIKVFDDLSISITALSSQKTARHSQQHGVAFWVNKRLVGEPSWKLNKRDLADGRTTIAKQYTIIVKTDDLLSDITEDWTDFKKSDRVEAVYDKVEGFASRLFKDINKDKSDDIKRVIVRKYANEIQNMDHSSRRTVLQLVDEVVDESPDLSKNYLEVTLAKLIDINKSRNKLALMEKVYSLAEQDAEKLNKILDDWDISDMEYVLDEIDRRLAVIQAIEKFSAIEGMDELHVLHPLVLEAKWLFGPEYDSSFYVSNKWLATTLRKYLKKPELVENLTAPTKRPDIILFKDGSLLGYSTEEYNTDIGLNECKRLLIIELKCGGKEISVTEMAQAEEYVNELFFSNAFNSQISINAFIVGDSVNHKMGRSKALEDNSKYEYGKLVATTYDQLVSTAKSRLFGLKTHLSERYDSMGVDDLLQRALEDNGQIAIKYVTEK